MPPKTMPTTVRLTEAEHTFLAQLKISDATSVSEKIRSLIAERKRLDEAGRDYSSALSLADSLLGSIADVVRVLENEHRIHSQLVRRMVEIVPELLASLISEGISRDSSVEDLEKLEERLAIQLLRLSEIGLQIYMSRDTSLYNEKAFGPERILPIRRLCMLAEKDISK